MANNEECLARTFMVGNSEVAYICRRKDRHDLHTAEIQVEIVEQNRIEKPTPAVVTWTDAKHVRKVTVNLNGKDTQVGEYLTYDEICRLAGEREGASVVCKPKDRRLAGFTVIRGQVLEATDGMIINCMMTGNA